MPSRLPGACEPGAPGGRPGDVPPGGRPGDAPIVGLRRCLGAAAERLLIGASVFRAPADRNALLFQVGEHDWTAARAADRLGPAPPYRAPAGLPDMIANCAAAGVLTIVSDGAWTEGIDTPAVFVDRAIATPLHAPPASEDRQT